METTDELIKQMKSGEAPAWLAGKSAHQWLNSHPTFFASSVEYKYTI